MEGDSLNGDPERLCETEMMLGLFWRTRYVGDGRTIEYLSKSVIYTGRGTQEGGGEEEGREAERAL